MKKIYATFDANGAPKGFWSDDIYPPKLRADGAFIALNSAIPISAIEITENDYLEILGNQGARRMVDGVLEVFRPPVPGVTLAQVKLEATRRVLILAPEWKQRNMMAKAISLLDKGRANWDATDTATSDAMNAIWAGIQNVRDKSDLLEAMTPIPDDYMSDTYWT